MTGMPVLYVAGDVHLVGGPSGFARWLDQLATRPPARLVLVGDLFEYWLDTAGAAARYGDVLGRIRALLAIGWRVDLVRGNREMSAGRRLEVATGSRLSWPALDLPLGPRRLRIVHGDRLCHDPGYRAFAAFMAGFWLRILALCVPAPVQDLVARHLRRRSRERQERRTPRDRVFIDRRRVQAAGRGVDTLIAGHIHQSWRRTIGGVDLILVGDWPGDLGHWVEGYADGRLERIAARLPG